MAKRALIILADGFEDIEAIACIDILRRAGIELVVAGLNNLQVKSARGKITVWAETTFAQTERNFDALILPGGLPGAESLAGSSAVIKLVKEMFNQGKIIAAICAAPALVLAKAGVLDGKTATCFPGDESDFPKTTKYKNERVVIDGNLITSQAAGTALEFALAIVCVLSGEEVANKVKKTILV